MIEEVRLVNIKSYTDSTIRFTDGVNAIIGENGAGKTTILEAIGFALFDTLPYRIGDFLRRGEKRGEVRVRFIGRDEREYEVVRKIEEGRTTAYYVNDIEVGRVAEGREVVEWMAENFGFEVDAKTVFENAIGVQQGKIVSHFLEPPSVRDSIFSPLIGVDSYRKAYEKSREYENFVKERTGEIERALVALSKDIEAKQRAEERLKELNKRRGAVNRQLEEISRVIEPLKIKIERMNSLSREFDGLSLEEARLAEKIAAEEKAVKELEEKLKETLELKKELEKLREEHDEYVIAEKRIGEIERKRVELDKARQSLIESKARLEALKADIEVAKKTIEDICRKEEITDELEKKAERERELQERLKELEILSVRKQEVEERLKMLIEEMENKKKTLEGLEEKKKRLSELEEKLSRIEDVEAARDKLLKAISGFKAKLEMSRKQYEQVKDGICPVLRENCDRIVGERERTFKKLKELEENLSKLEEKFSKAQKAVERKRQLEEVVSRLKGELKNLTALKEEIEKKEGTLRDLKEEREKISERLSEKKKVVEDLKEVEGSMEKLAALKAEIERKNSLLEELEKKEEVAHKLEREMEKLPEVEKELGEIENELNSLKKLKEERKDAYLRYIGLSEKVADGEKIEVEVKQRRKELESLKKRYNEVKSRLDEVKKEYSKEEHEKLRDKLGELISEESRMKGELKTLESEIFSVKKEIEELSKKEQEFRELSKAKDKLNAKYRFIKDMREIFKISIPEITRAYVEAVSIEANRIFCELMDDYSWELRWTEDFGIIARYRGREIELVQMSGGEQMCAALAVRLALLKVLSNVNTVFFDEPTQNMDESRRRNFAAQLSRIEGFKQIFVISHDDTFEEMVENAIKLRKENGVSIIA